ncbi:MAG TPA: DUF2179 domain-containing protein [Firmicutes bacterium]|nr:DUF2179 domain-containing protein [Bacillota bacterium]
MEVALGYLLVFAARVLDMSMATIRLLLVVRGKRLQAAVIGFFEVIIYVLALNMVVKNLDNIFNLLAYALGFATGNYVGSYVEEKMALGHATVQVIPKDKDEHMDTELRKLGYGVTVVTGTGREGPRRILLITVRRKKLPELMRVIDELDRDSFVTVMDTQFIHGGFWGKKAK